MYYGVDNSSNYFAHRAKNGTMNSTTSEKGTDGKANNSSAYNHAYYMKNKEKWNVKYDEQTDGDKDFDDANFTDENRLGDTDFYGIKNADGSWTVIEENMKWKLPAGVSRDAIVKAVGAVSQQDKQSRMSAKDFERAVSSALENMPGGKGGQEFDVDAAARDVIRGKYKNGAERKAALGDDYAVVQKRVNELMKAKHSDEDGDVLEHHGILGQKWGVRRFQKLDGTRTAAGKARENGESSGNAQNGGTKQGIDKEKLKKAALIGAGVAVSAALIANPTTRAALSKYGKTALSNLPSAAAKVGGAVGKGAAKIVNKTEERASKVGDAMIDAALLSAGGIAISKLGDQLAPTENDTESQKNTKKIALDVATAGINSATGANKGSNSGSNGGKGGSVGKEVTDKLGTPSKKGIDKQSSDWQNLFKDSNGNQLDAETRGTIKALASQGYDMDQIKQYKKEFGHTDIHEWIDSIISDPTRW